MWYRQFIHPMLMSIQNTEDTISTPSLKVRFLGRRITPKGAKQAILFPSLLYLLPFSCAANRLSSTLISLP